MKEKRIRGLRRHSRNHRRWAAVPVALDWVLVEKHQESYEQLGLKPWNVHGKPPLTIRKLWISRLLTDFQQWFVQLKSNYSEFYLAIWLYEPRFGKSQLVVKTAKTEIERYKNWFGEIVNNPLPIEYQSSQGAERLRWTAHPEVDFFDEEEFAALGLWGIRKPHRKVDTIFGPRIAIQTGWVWVGQIAP